MSQTFESLGLSPELVRAVAEEGYTQPTPIQAQAIPLVLAGRDVLAAAQTGTGKTAGFTLPMLQRLERHGHHGGRHAVRALVLTPTRELAAQVEESVRTYGKHMNLRTTLVFGGVGMQPQVDALRHGVDVLVATPGRLLDHLGEKTVNLSHVEILVLDEADRMLDMGFIRDIRKVLAALPAERQNLLFSATFSDEIRDLAHGLLRNPATVEVARRNAESELVAQRIYLIDQNRKRQLLAHLVREGDWHQVLVFTRTKHGANRLAEQLQRDGIEATPIHGNKSQNARTRALAGFKDGSVRVLVATDLAARGLDIEELPHVVNYELPNVPEDYVHRIGRTGRAGCTGEAISFVAPDEREHLTNIERLVRRKLERTEVPELPPLPAPAPQAKPAHPVAAPGQPAPAGHESRGPRGQGKRPERGPRPHREGDPRRERGQPQHRDARGRQGGDREQQPRSHESVGSAWNTIPARPGGQSRRDARGARPAQGPRGAGGGFGGRPRGGNGNALPRGNGNAMPRDANGNGQPRRAEGNRGWRDDRGQRNAPGQPQPDLGNRWRDDRSGPPRPPREDLPDDIGNRIAPAAPRREEHEDERQPASNASSLFPSSGAPERRPGGRRGSGPVPALLRGGQRRGG